METKTRRNPGLIFNNWVLTVWFESWMDYFGNNYLGSFHLSAWIEAFHLSCYFFPIFVGLLLLFGTYLAWETRQVHIPALNDSKLIGMSVYNVIIPCVLVIPILGVVQDKPTTKFALTSFLTVFCTTLTLCLVFVPKVCWINCISFSSQVKDDLSLYKIVRIHTHVQAEGWMDRFIDR